MSLSAKTDYTYSHLVVLHSFQSFIKVTWYSSLEKEECIFSENVKLMCHFLNGLVLALVGVTGNVL